MRIGRIACLELGDALQNNPLKLVEGGRIVVGTLGLLNIFEKLRQIFDGLACGSTSHNLIL